MSDEIRDAIVESAKGPKVVSQDDTRVEQHPLKDLVDARQHISQDVAADKPHRGLRFTRLVQPGATS